MPKPRASEGCPHLLSLSVHELRTPVTVVAGYLRMLLKGQAGGLSDRQRRLLEETERSCGRLADLVSQLSELASLDAGTGSFQRVDVPFFRLLADAASGVREGDDRGVRLELRGAEPEAIVVGDPGRLRTALAAIVTSVLRERAEPGVLVAECAVRPERKDGKDGKDGKDRRRGRRWAVVGIGDEASVRALYAGDGPKTRATFDEWRGGMGLALPIARRVIEGHGGTIWSEPHSDGQSGRSTTGLALPVKET